MAALAAAAYVAAVVYVTVVRPARKRRQKPVYKIKDGKIYLP